MNVEVKDLNKIAAYRKLIGVSQADMAKKLGISLTSYNKKENGRREFTQSEMIEITKIFQEKLPDITMDAIFFNNELSILPRCNESV